MSPITAQQAWDATDASQTDDQRETAAASIIQGVAANDAYLNSRSELEQLKYLAQGPQVVPHATLNDPTEVGGGTATDSIEGTSTEEVAKELGSGTSAGSDPGHPGAENPEATIASLRKQIEDAGLKPEA